MRRRRSSAPGRRGPDGRRPLILLAAMVFALAGCGQATSTNEPTTPAQSGATDVPSPSEPVATPSTEPPSEPPTPSVDPATPGPATPSSGPQPGASANPGSAAACSGSDENRDFFASMSAAVDWSVYCPVLPAGWFVDDGQYRLANGGWMRISYEGPGGGRIVLQQGAFCTEVDGCVPSGREAGETAFGDRAGTLVAGDDGSWSVVVDRSGRPSWLLIVTGLGEADARSIAAHMLAIRD